VVGKIGPGKADDEIRRITRSDEWHNLVDDVESEDHGDTTLHDSSLPRATVVVRPWHEPQAGLVNVQTYRRPHLFI
jgi:hypothetical protein